MITDEWIDDCVKFLNSKVGIYKPGSGANFNFNPTAGFYGYISTGEILNLNESIALLANYIGAIGKPVIVPWSRELGTVVVRDDDRQGGEDYAGLIKHHGPGHSTISINPTHRHSHYIMGAILAHELAHHFLFTKKIFYDDTLENEKLTDVATVFLGLGKLTLNGYHVVSWTVKKEDGTAITYKERIGYLNQKEMAKVYKHIMNWRSIPLDSAKESLSDSSIYSFINSDEISVKAHNKPSLSGKIASSLAKIVSTDLFTFFNKNKEKDKQRDKDQIPTNATAPDEYIVVNCTVCSQKLRIPKPKREVVVNCSKCNSHFNVKINYK